MEIVPARIFNSLYIWLDSAFLVFFLSALWFTGRRKTCLFGLAGGLLYFIVDYGIFFLALHERVVQGAPTGPFLFWLSMSYGVTNFAWIWLMLDRDPKWKEWTILIFFAWICNPLISQNFGGNFGTIHIWRGTGSYHGAMAAILLVGYAIVCVMNIRYDKNIPVVRLLVIGIAVQFGWEFALLVTGIRQSGLETLAINSLVETNLGMPYLYFIHRALTKRFGATDYLIPTNKKGPSEN